MWIYFIGGFVSIKRLSICGNTFCVRARDEESLKAFIEKVPVQGKMYHAPDADYLWKIDLEAVDVAYCLLKRMNDIKYDSFKDNIVNKTIKVIANKLWLITLEAFLPRDSIFKTLERRNYDRNTILVQGKKRT